MLNCISTSVVLAQAIPHGTSFGGWMMGSLTSLSSVMVLISGLLLLGGACYLVSTKRRPVVLAAYLVLLPLPVLIAVYGQLCGVVLSLVVVASSPGVSLPTEDIAAGLASSFVGVLFAMLISAPSYFVLAFGLLARTLNPPTDSTPPSPIRSDLREPLLSSGGPMPATT